MPFEAGWTKLEESDIMNLCTNQNPPKLKLLFVILLVTDVQLKGTVSPPNQNYKQ